MTEPMIKPVVCFGEILWDSLPRGLFPGGAPMNVAYHLKQLGVTPLPVTAVGRDQLGDELLRRLKTWDVDNTGVSVNSAKATGMARVSLVDGSPKFEIVEDVAWDWIEVVPQILDRASECAAIVFGSLAQRSENNCRQLAALLDRSASTLKVFDVNLRAPYDSAAVVWALAKRADLVKLSDSELNQLLDKKFAAREFETGVREFSQRTGVQKVCLTAGGDGAGLLLGDKWIWEQPNPVTIRDTVGAGDSFLAGLLSGLLRASEPPAEILRRACRLAEFVVTQDGATPSYHIDDQGNVTGSQDHS